MTNQGIIGVGTYNINGATLWLIRGILLAPYMFYVRWKPIALPSRYFYRVRSTASAFAVFSFTALTLQLRLRLVAFVFNGQVFKSIREDFNWAELNPNYL